MSELIIPQPDVPVALLLADGTSISDDDQVRIAMSYAAEHALRVVTHAGHRPSAAAASVRCGRAQAVLTPVAGVNGQHVDLSEVRVIYARTRLDIRTRVEDEFICTALRRSNEDVRLVSFLLAIPADRVRALSRETTQEIRSQAGIPANHKVKSVDKWFKKQTKKK